MNKKVDSKKNNFLSALSSLERAVHGPKTEEVQIAGIIKMFEFTYETCWKWLKALLEEQGIMAESPRKIFVEAFSVKMIDDEQVWLDMIDARNETAHTYKKDMALEMVAKINDNFLPQFIKLKNKAFTA